VEKFIAMQIDAFDKEILDIVQGDNQLSHLALYWGMYL